MDDHSPDLYMSAVSIAEIKAGIAKLRRQRPAARLTISRPGSVRY
jgi:hypothetical protein